MQVSCSQERERNSLCIPPSFLTSNSYPRALHWYPCWDCLRFCIFKLKHLQSAKLPEAAYPNSWLPKNLHSEQSRQVWSHAFHHSFYLLISAHLVVKTPVLEPCEYVQHTSTGTLQRSVSRNGKYLGFHVWANIITKAFYVRGKGVSMNERRSNNRNMVDVMWKRDQRMQEAQTNSKKLEERMFPCLF